MIRILLVTIIISMAGINDLAAQNGANPNEKKPAARVKQYWFVMLTKGANRSQDSASAARIQEGHMANISRLYYAGKLKVAGPFGDDGDWQGIFIFDCETKEEVEKLLVTDPAFIAGRLAYDIHPWWTAETGSFKSGVPLKEN
ncbi:MAG: YciI family protein [Ferruginibacter sp.]